MSTGAHGPIDVDLDRTDDVDIRADVRGDLHVHPGVQVRIKGSFDGTITVDHDAYLVIGGDCGGRILRNDGRIVLAGTVSLPLGRGVGPAYCRQTTLSTQLLTPQWKRFGPHTLH